MNENQQSKLQKLVNASGFLFQLRVEDEVRKTFSKHGWEVISREHAWGDVHGGRGGFIDLVLEKGHARMVVECKRPRDATWVFLLSSRKKKRVERARFQWTYIGGDREKEKGGVYEFGIAPTPEAEFCAIRGTGEDRPMLERISATLLDAIDWLACEELQLAKRRHRFGARIYLPTIITTARLVVCPFERGKVGIGDGMFSSNGEFEDAPFVLFRKPLTTKCSPRFNPPDVGEANRDRERTILVINSAELVNVLSSHLLSLPYEGWPWGK